ncbi:nucleotide exchange factor GrpE [Candidatus Roizmanbacteria bacterium RIFOXYB2_FULL_41_10]|uniref:Protein GrpE n=1 Tax=Candidatus Roizmanbacteria bacterium RIFOXYA1_FULL_41_12 TaxID=1802082 RepID=A0A1F7KGG3_9BACT|nr:MAG: nucleotide exchange factor GrpE [Candidatus Roizmanbacteria bacterium RIFOXYA2_FULL_41_8]OGK66944.1 MAG: nucleotide exchange factor GrpE [Candidatus Roizmanbacteria bacterium RIFOXYA1_FULL_41_12]OGK67210.1 MAG: nucleotide exchange factor GrpE [Candidatus Roizmanbacteria bacterium RIFOXYB1_FULL_41_27]OGK72271.1 MAG: nucleotide exchange factor GrpE [Candidatus Roizmanbacteria bacterium RIFOXYB2_FULL_41_10]OGK72305.1 MAG: nucleotide exchange factor GrpE [Candidatus Roizmanbacteria bacteriu
MKPAIEELKKELTEKHNLYLRALADYQNLEKRMLQAKDKEIKNFLFGFLKQLIELKEDMDKAQTFNQDPGLKLVYNKLKSILNRYSIREINPLNKEFSPETMECVQTVFGKKSNLVVQVFSKGYFYNDELLQPAKVAVSQLEVIPPTVDKKQQ